MKKDEYAGVPWPVAAKRISQAWKQLDDQGRAMYQQMAKQEINEQHEAMVEHGLRKQADGVSAEEHGGHGGVTPFDAQTVQYGRYVLLRQGEIGRGTFGRVMVAKERNTERRVALKVFEDEAEAKLEIPMYTYMSSMGGHRNILPLLEHETTPPPPHSHTILVPAVRARAECSRCLEGRFIVCIRPDWDGFAIGRGNDLVTHIPDCPLGPEARELIVGLSVLPFNAYRLWYGIEMSRRRGTC